LTLPRLKIFYVKCGANFGQNDEEGWKLMTGKKPIKHNNKLFSNKLFCQNKTMFHRYIKVNLAQPVNKYLQ